MRNNNGHSRTGSPKRQPYSACCILLYAALGVFIIVIGIELFSYDGLSSAFLVTDKGATQDQQQEQSVPIKGVATIPAPRGFKLDPPFDECCSYGEIDEMKEQTSKLRKPALIGIGQHKAGTSFLFNLLKIDPIWKEPHDSEGKIVKELFTIGRWPLADDAFLQYLNMWDQEEAAQEPDSILYEITATYIQIPGAACRMKKLLPDAKFVVVIREPVGRALSHFNMEKDLFESKQRPLPPKPFPDSIQNEYNQLQEEGCLFDGTRPQGKKSWNDCYKCWYVKEDKQKREDYCVKHKLQNAPRGENPCNPTFQFSQFTTFGMITPQIKWWLRFFPREQFMFINNDDLRENPLDVANRVARFMGIAPTYTQEAIDEGKASKVIDGNTYTQTLSEEDPSIRTTLKKLKQLYRDQVRELYDLFDEIGVDFDDFKEWPRTEFETKKNKTEYEEEEEEEVSEQKQ